MDRKVHIHHQMAGVKSLNVAACYFLFLMNSRVVYVDLNHNTVFRLKEVLRVLSVTCEVTGSSLNGGEGRVVGRDGGAEGEGRQSDPVFFTQEVCFNITLFLLFCSCKGRQVLGNCLCPCPA